MATSERAHLRALLKDFRDGMLVTRGRGPDGAMRARPMSIAKLEENNDLLFATSVDSAKVDEAVEAGQAAVTFQSGMAYVSVSGPVEIVKDRAKIDAAWNEAMRVWFPKGKEDPTLCLLRLQPAKAEFWDLQGTKGIRYVFEAAKAYVSGTQPTTSPDQHGVVDGPRGH
jgi:general stress protein 26